MGSEASHLAESYAEPRPAHTPRVLIDARKIGDGGIGVYLNNLISGLVEHGLAQVSILARPERAAAMAWRGRVELIPDRTPLYSMRELFLARGRAFQSRFDLFHSPHFTLPFGLRIPSVVTVHDLIHVYHPEKPFYPLIAAPLIRSALKRADRVLTVSRTTAQEISRLVRANPAVMGKVRVIPNAVDPVFLYGGSGALRKNGILGGAPYLFAMLSLLKPHKGLNDLLDAFAALKRALAYNRELAPRFADLRLVIAGLGSEKLVESSALLNKAGSVPGVLVLGRLSGEELAEWYGGAVSVVVASRTEGFCLPALEAKACGVRVVSRPVPAVLELLDGSDVVCKDMSVPGLQAGLEEALVRAGVGGGGRSESRTEYLARCYGREIVSRRTMEIYREVLER